MGSGRKTPFARLALVCLGAAALAFLSAAEMRDPSENEVSAPTRLARALGRRAEGAGAAARRAEALLPEMIDILPMTANTAGARRVRIKFTPKLSEPARMEIGSSDPALARAIAAQAAPSRLIRAGDAPAEREIEWTPDSGAKTSVLRIGLIFTDEAARVSMTAHREFPLSTAESDEPAKPSSAAPLVRDSRGAVAATYRAEAPAPVVTKREAR